MLYSCVKQTRQISCKLTPSGRFLIHSCWVCFGSPQEEICQTAILIRQQFSTSPKFWNEEALGSSRYWASSSHYDDCHQTKFEIWPGIFFHVRFDGCVESLASVSFCSCTIPGSNSLQCNTWKQLVTCYCHFSSTLWSMLIDFNIE